MGRDDIHTFFYLSFNCKHLMTENLNKSSKHFTITQRQRYSLSKHRHIYLQTQFYHVLCTFNDVNSYINSHTKFMHTICCNIGGIWHLSFVHLFIAMYYVTNVYAFLIIPGNFRKECLISPMTIPTVGISSVKLMFRCDAMGDNDKVSFFFGHSIILLQN